MAKQIYEVHVNEQGDKYWYQNGKYHRLDGPAIERVNGDKFWCQNDQLHRTDGPAIERANGDKYWYQNDKRHRLDGPAVEWANGEKYWYIDGKKLSEKQFNAKMNQLNTKMDSCAGKIVEIDGKKYKLTEI